MLEREPRALRGECKRSPTELLDVAGSIVGTIVPAVDVPARQQPAQSRIQGHSRIVLVGDPEYYNQFGFRRDLALNIQLPGWVEERRFLALELVAGSMIGVHGMVGKAPPKAARRRKRG